MPALIPWVFRPDPGAKETTEVFLEEVKASREQVLGTEEEGFQDTFITLNAERVLAAATATGIAQACLDASVHYARERMQFGRPIGTFQFVQGMLAEMAMVKLFPTRMAVTTAQDAVQIHGGYGYIKEFPLERYYRDAKLGEIGGGTSEVLKLVVGRTLMKGV